MPKKTVPATARSDTVDTQHAHSGQCGHAQPKGTRFSPRRRDGCILLSTDKTGEITRVNPFGEAFFGMGGTDILGKKFFQIVLADNFKADRKKKRAINHFLHTPQTNGFAEFKTRHSSGRQRRVAWTRSAVRDSAGALVELLLVGIDVQKTAAESSERRQLDEVGICESNLNYSILEKHLECSNVWAWEIDADALFRYVSPGVESILGYSRDELIGMEMDFLMHRDAHGRSGQSVGEAIRGGKRQFTIENQLRRKNGELLWSETSGVIFYDENNLFLGARGLNRDVSREIAAREELALKEQEYRYLFDNTQVGLMMLNEKGVVLNINQTGANMHGRDPGEMMGRIITEFIPKTERGAALEAFSKAYRTVKAQKTNFVNIESHIARLETPQGPRYLRLVPNAIKVMENGKMVGILNTVLDITESHTLQKELERHQLQLQQLVDERTVEIQTLQEEMLRNERLTTLGRLTSTVSHEIRNPLGTINSSFYFINERLKEKDDGISRALSRGFRAIRKCDGILEEMLDFTRTNGLEKRTLDISSWLENLLDKVKAPKNVSIIRMIDSGLSAPVDAGRLHRCVKNVLENSLTAIREENEGIIRVSARMSGERLEISIRDNGPGISKRLGKRVFDPLYSTKQNGIGMGLPVCGQVMELHGGSIVLRSDKGRGTTVLLYLPSSRKM